MATKQQRAPLAADAFRDGEAVGQRAIDPQGDIWEYRGGQWVRTGLNEQQRVPVGILDSIGAGVTKTMSAPLRMFQGEQGDENSALVDKLYGQNPVSYIGGQVAGGLPGGAVGGWAGAGAGLARNVGIQGMIGALSDAEDPLTGALLAIGTVGGAGLLQRVAGARAARSGAPVLGAADEVGGAVAPARGAAPGPSAFGPLPAQPAGTFSSRAPGGGAGAMPARAGQRQLTGAAGVADESGQVAGPLRRPMDPAQLREAESLGLQVPPGYRLGSDMLQDLESRTSMQNIMATGTRRNQNVFAREAGKAAGIEGRPVNQFTLDEAMSRTQSGFEAMAKETQPVPKMHVEQKLAELTSDPLGHAPLVQRLKRAPEELDGRQLSALQSFLAKERFKFNKAGDLNMADAYGRAHDSVMGVIERGLPVGSRGNFARLRQEYQAQSALNRPGVLGAGDTVNPRSFVTAVGKKTQRGSDELLRAQLMAKHLSNWRDVLPMTGARNDLASAGGAAIGALLGPLGAAAGSALGTTAGRMGSAAAFDLYRAGAPMLHGLMQRGAGGFGF